VHAADATGAEGQGLDAVFGLRADLYRDYRRFYGLFYERELVPLDLLELVRLAVAELLGCASELAIRFERDGRPLVDESRVDAARFGGDESRLAPGERACLDFAHQFVLDVHGVTDAGFAAVRDHLGVAGSVALTEALALFDGFMRFRKLLDVQPIGDGSAPVYVEMPTCGSAMLP
jgi:alkylhydroperoxidase family enzyme